MKYCLDANVFITAWNQIYPPDTFPSLHAEKEDKLRGEIILIKPVFDEIEPGSAKAINEKPENYPVRIWLTKDLKISSTDIGNDARQQCLELMNTYETDNHSKGADETDIALIAYASANNHTIVALEAVQQQTPQKKSSYKTL